MPPEILERKPYNEKADIWALGCSIYELTSFHTPYEAPNIDILYQKIKSGLPQRIDKKYSDELWNLITKMLTYDYNFRPNSIEDIKDIYYTVLNNGWIDFTFYCPKSYTNCVEDVRKIANNNEYITKLNGYVSPFNSYKK